MAGSTVEMESGLGDFHLTIPAGDEGDSTLSCPTTGAIPVPNNCPTNRTGDLDIHTHIRVIGQGVADSIIDATHVTRIFDVHNDTHGHGELELTDLTLQTTKRRRTTSTAARSTTTARSASNAWR